MKSVDEAIHIFYEMYDSKYGIRWKDFRTVGIEEYYYDYYYAENELYVIRHRIDHSCYFIQAKSPKHALDVLRDLTYLNLGNEEEYE